MPKYELELIKDDMDALAELADEKCNEAVEEAEADEDSEEAKEAATQWERIAKALASVKWEGSEEDPTPPAAA
jgi:hypothetical protein